MSQATIKRVRLIYGIVLSVLLVVTGILLMIACFSIYRRGSEPFTPANIADAFRIVCVPMIITAVAAVGAIVFWLIYPPEAPKKKATVPLSVQLERVERTINYDLCHPTLLTAIYSEKKLRRLLLWLIIVMCVVFTAPAAIYVLNFSHFTIENYNSDVVAACMYVLPCSFIGLGCGLSMVYAKKGSILREMELAKIAVEKYGAVKVERTAPVPASIRSKRIVLGVRIALAVIALSLVIAGIVNGGMADVLAKAINICTECIGLG
ncbi:MAG: hypothetical protein IJY22_02865 [Clostridia bacterium]|nr:hypothetical protein [Clostridia bacterium]